MIPSVRRPSRALALLVLAASVLVACSSAGVPSSSNAATVGEAEISNEQLQRDMALFRFLAGVSGGECGTPIEGETQESACARLALSSAISAELVGAYVSENGLALGGGVLEEAIGQLEAGAGGPQELDGQLESAGVTRADLESLGTRLLLFEVVRDDLVAQGVDEAVLREAYEEQAATYTTVEVAHILVTDPAKAEEIAGEVTPETFARIAERESQDPGTGAEGGNLGSYSVATFRTRFVPEFVAGALALEPGEISPPVQTQFGWHVIYLIREDVAPFEDVRQQLEEEQGGPLFDQWLVDQAAATEIEVNPRYGRFDPETLEVLPVRSTEEDPADVTGTATGP